MSKRILGLDLGTNSIGWALLEADDSEPSRIIDIGCRIFSKAVNEGKTAKPKNVDRRDARLARRVIQRRAQRKKRLMNYLVKLGLLPQELKGTNQPEIILNQLGDPYQLRAKALDHELSGYELGRVLLHLAQRRGFLSNRKTLIGDMVDDPDVQDVLIELEELEEQQDLSSDQEKDETAFKRDISELRNQIKSTKSPSATSEYCRTLGEYLSTLEHHQCKRNRDSVKGLLRTDRQMYRDELALIWEEQSKHHIKFDSQVQQQVEEIIFHQRPLKLRADRIGRCSLEPSRKRAKMARLESQRFRYLLDINNLKYFEPDSEKWLRLNQEQRQTLISLFEIEPDINVTKIRNALGFSRKHEFNLERGDKKISGNTTACAIRKYFPDWDTLDNEQQVELVEDLTTIKKKSVLKKRLLSHWSFDVRTAVNLCLLPLEPNHSSLSTKAINRLLPFLESGQIDRDARVSAGYGYETKEKDITDSLGPPPEIPNPIVQKGLHELRRLVNAVIAEYGKPDSIRIEMARDLEMNTKRYKAYLKQQKENTEANKGALKAYNDMGQKYPHLNLAGYPSYDDKIKYRLWRDQDEFCAYSLKKISLAELFSPEIEVDHILPYSQTLDDSYMNKVVCITAENRHKGQRTPYDAYSRDEDKWTQITGAIRKWGAQLQSKQRRFYTTSSELLERDFSSSQLNDSRYISRVALEYLSQLGSDIITTKGQVTAWLRHQWGLNTLLGDTDKKERTDHRHHTIDALAIACVDRKFHRTMISIATDLEQSRTEVTMRDIHVDTPWPRLRSDLHEALGEMIVSHSPQLKLTGALHEKTGAGFIEGIGNVHRVNLDSNFEVKSTNKKTFENDRRKFVQKRAEKIIDTKVKNIVLAHLERHDNNPKLAFSEEKIVFHKDGRTPIKRVRIRQSKTTLKKLESTKFGVKDRNGKIFKWLRYGNMHHVEIVQHIQSGKFSGYFVTTMEAHHRAKGIGMHKQPIIQKNHGEGYEFVMALHINDLVSLKKNGQQCFYRVQKLDAANKFLALRLHTASTLNNPADTLLAGESTITALMSSHLQKHQINAIGKLMA